MAGYSGFSKSNNAIEAEEGGRYPLSIAVPFVARSAGVTHAVAKAVLIEIGPTEWHHTSKKYNRTAYYNTNTAFNLLLNKGNVAMLEGVHYRDRINAAYKAHPGQNYTDCPELAAKVDAAYAEIAAASGVSVGVIRNAYYKTWEIETTD